MKIIFDHQIFTLQAYGGISRYFVRLAQGLAALNVEPRIIAPIYRSRYLKDLSKDYVRGFPVKHFIPRTTEFMTTINSVWSRLNMPEKHDVLHETYYSKKPVIETRGPRVVTVYDMIHEKYPDKFSRGSQIAASKLSAIRRANHIICISHNTKKDLCEMLGVNDEKVTVIHLGFDASSFPLTFNSVVKERPFLLYVGSRSGYKNFEGFIRAFASQSQLKNDFEVVAFGGDAFTPRELMIFKELGLKSGAIRQLNGTDQVLGKLYRTAAAFIYPSLYEGFGLPPLEAMAHGCPVVASNSSSMPEVIGDAGQYFDPLDIDAQAAAIMKVVFDVDRRSELIKNGANRLMLFSWNKCSVETLKTYQKL